jgi:hypothetical protein
MAKVTVNGEVASVAETKTGKPVISIWEMYQDSQDMQRNRRWTLWVPMTGFESIVKETNHRPQHQLCETHSAQTCCRSRGHKQH